MIDHLLNQVHQGDCLEFMRQLPDECVDLVLTDPPYGIHDKISAKGALPNAGNRFARLYDRNPWDRQRPDKEYFEQIFRISGNQVICGANYFVEHLPVSRGWIFWDKLGDGMTSVNNELIYTSFDRSIATFRRCHGLDKGFMVTDGFGGIHPTQKPVALMRWIIEKYSKPTDIIFDPFLGSGTTAVAAYQLGRRWFGCEINPEYCEIARKRIAAEMNNLFHGKD